LNLKPNSRYVGVVYKDNYDDTSEVHFYTEGGFDTGNEILAVDKSTDTTVTLTASGFVKGQNYDIYLSSDTTSGTAININNDKKSSPVSAEFGGATVSFDGLVKGKQYVAYIIKNSNTKEALGRVYFTAGDASSGTNTATNTGTGTGTNISTGIAATDAEFSGIVPKCNTGDIDTATGQYKNPCNFDFFMKLLNSIIKFLLFTIATPLVALIVMYTGYLYLTAGGSAGQTEKAKHILFNVVVGYIIALAAWLIINTIVTSLLPKDTTINTFLQKDTFQK